MTWTERTKPNTDFHDRTQFLATESLLYLLTEDNKKIQISGSSESDYTTRTKPTTNWTN